MVGGDGQFNAFARQSEHPLLNRGVAVPAVSKRVHMRVAGDQARGRDFPANPHWQRVSPARREREALRADAVFEAARGVEGIVTGRQPDAHRPAARVNHARTDGQRGLSVFHVKREQRAVPVRDGDAAGQRLLRVFVSNADHKR